MNPMSNVARHVASWTSLLSSCCSIESRVSGTEGGWISLRTSAIDAWACLGVPAFCVCGRSEVLWVLVLVSACAVSVIMIIILKHVRDVLNSFSTF